MFLLGSLIVPAGKGFSQMVDYGTLLGTRRGGETTFEPVGVGVLFGALDPAVKKWYMPQELFREYQWRQWEYTNYARESYKRYVNISLEGDYYYDLYGSFVTRGWLIYDWRQDQPERSGSSLIKDKRYTGWFDRLLIASDSKGEYHTALTIGDEIRTTLTPMTFSKPTFNGVQWDFQSDKYAMTALFSRISLPLIGTDQGAHLEKTSNTNLTALRGTAQVGHFVKVGATYVNSHQSHTLLESFSGSPLSGNLTTDQNSAKVSKIVLRLSDDSPEDKTGGAALYSFDVIIKGKNRLTGEMETVRGGEIGFRPILEGGFQERGYLAANGEETITLPYDFTDPSYTGPDATMIERVTFELVVANDYRLEWTSDRQTNRDNQPVFLLVARAPGNVRDNSNQRIVRFDYGLPTANEIYGFTFEVNDLMGFNVYAEFDRNRRFRQYPNVNKEKHYTAVETSDAWMVNVSKWTYPYFAFGEAYSIDGRYSTTAFVVDDKGAIDYENKLQNRYEFVDDNDDQDRYPDWGRVHQHGGSQDHAVFPGWDENNDFISDFNQNDNLVPDYEEPFLRYSVDRPEFLFGIDMNNNFWADRFENDEEPDYPYKRDHQGYNVYVGAHIIPDVRLTLGRQHEWLMAQNNKNRTHYALFTLDKDYAGLGRLRIFSNVRLSKDDISDNLFQWVQPSRSSGTQQRIADPLAARNTWINSTFLGFDYTGVKNLTAVNKVKFDLWDQRDRIEGLRDTHRFFGLINKADYTVRLGNFRIQPRIKNEFRRETPVLKNDSPRKENMLLFLLVTKFPILKKSEIELGTEFSMFRQLQEPTPAGLQDDYEELIGALQLTNRGDYFGYKLTTQIGMRVGRKFGEKTTTASFITVYAGAE
jgi:hypothetical protein